MAPVSRRPSPFDGDVHGSLHDLQLSSETPLTPQQEYGPSNAPLKLRIANGGAGQSGLIGALAVAFIDYVKKNASNRPPEHEKWLQRVREGDDFKVGWYLGDTTQSLEYIEHDLADIAVTYNEAAELQSIKDGFSLSRIYGFRDRFMLVGPRENPARLEENDDILTMFNKINKSGKQVPATSPPTRFLSRYDKSATNIKESSLFAMIGQVPWAYAYSTWYHQYARFPLEALKAASQLSEYTLTDYGTYLSSPEEVQNAVVEYKMSSGSADDLLLNPAHVLFGKAARENPHAILFMLWMHWAEGGQAIVATYAPHGKVLYLPAPDE